MENFDNQPVGQHVGSDISEFPTTTTEECKDQPLSEKLISKNAKVRFDGTCELVKILNEGSEPPIENFNAILQKLLADSHPGVQEKAIDSFVILFSKAPKSVCTSGIISVIIEKCLTSLKTATKSKAMEAIINASRVSSEVFDTVKSTIYSKSASPKLLAIALNVFTQLLIKFGNSAFPIQSIIPQVVVQAGASNVAVKNESMELLKEFYKWIRDELLPYLKPLKPAQQDDLKKSFAEVKDLPVLEDSKKEKKKPTPEVQVEEKKELAVLDKFDDKWCTSVLKLMKWKDKKEKLEQLAAATNADKIKLGNFSELGNMLKLMLDDSNVTVANLVIRIIGQLAKGLCGYFSIYAKHMFLKILHKCKDKKTVVESKKCLENLAYALKLEAILDDVKEALVDKSPLVKMYICFWLTEVAFPMLKPELVSLWIKQLAPLLLKLINDAVQDTRNAAIQCLGALKGLTQDEELNKLMGDIDLQKQQKITKAAEEITRTVSGPLELNESVQNSSKRRESENLFSFTKLKSQDFEETKLNIKSERITPKHELCPVFTSTKDKSTEQNIEQPHIDVQIEDIGTIITQENAEAIVNEKIPAELIKDFDTDDRIAKQMKLTNLSSWLINNPILDTTSAEALALWLKRHMKDFKEDNESIMREVLELLNVICVSASPSKGFACIVVPGIAEKLGDANLLDACRGLILTISDSATPFYVASLVVQTVNTSRSVSLVTEALNVLLIMVNKYSTRLMPLENVLNYSKCCLEHINSQVRTNATNLILAVYSQLGEQVKPFILSNLKDSVHRSLELELAKIKVQPSLTINRSAKGTTEVENKPMPIKNDEPAARVNIAPQITSSLLSDIESKSMETRQEAKNVLERILSEANHHIQSAGLNTLIGALKKRMNESCKNLARSYITLTGNLAAAMGPGCKQYVKTILPALICNLADKQAAIKTETRLAIDKFSGAAGAESVINCIGSLLEKENPDLRTELLEWIIKNKGELGKADTSSLVGPLIGVIQDRNNEIRSLGEQVIEEVIQYQGYEVFMNAAKDLKPAVKSSLKVILDKCKLASKNAEEGGAYIDMEDMRKLVLDKCNNSEKLTYKDPKRKTYNGPEKSAVKGKERFNKPSSKNVKVGKVTGKVPVKTKELPAQKKSTRLESEETQRTTHMTSERGTYRKGSYKETGSLTARLPPKPTDSKKGTTVLIKKKLKPTETINRMSRSKPRDLSSAINLPNLNKAESLDQGEEGGAASEPAIIGAIGNKKKRAEEDKTMRWPVNEVRPNYVAKLKKTLSAAVNPTMLKYMFTDNAKNTLKVIEVIIETIKSNSSVIVDILDLLFKWCTMKLISQSNSSVNEEIMKFLSSLFSELYQLHYALQEFESASIIPILCEKLGASQPSIRESCKELIKKARELCPVSKIYRCLIMSLNSPNAKIKSEALAMVIDLMRAYENQMVVIEDIKTVAKLLDSNDNTVKTEAITFLGEIYKEKKENLWSLIGNISEKSKAMLRQKLESIAQPNLVSKNTKSKKMEKGRNDFSETDSIGVTNSSFLANQVVLGNTKEESKKPELGEDFATKDIPERHQTIITFMELLKSEEIAKKVDGLVLFNEKVSTLIHQNKQIVTSHALDMFMAFGTVLKEVLEKPLYAVPWKFCKYFAFAFNNLCGFQFLVRAIDEKTLFFIMEQLLGKLLYDRLDKRGDEGEGKYIITSLNEAILKLLENSDPTTMIAILLSIVKKYNHDNVSILASKCLIKLCKAMKSIISSIDISKVLLLLHVYLQELISLQAHCQEEVIGIRVTKCILNEIVKAQQESIWEDYKQSIGEHSNPDIYIKTWIRMLLPSSESVQPIEDLKDVLKKLDSQVTFNEAISKLGTYLSLYPNVNIEEYLTLCSPAFSQLVLCCLYEYRANLKTDGKEEDKEAAEMIEKAKARFLMEKKEMIKDDAEVIKDNLVQNLAMA